MGRVGAASRKEGGVLTKLQVAYDKFGDWLGILSNCILIGAMLLTVGNIIVRQFGSPFGGTAEVVGYCSACLTALALVYSQKRKAHIAIDILSGHFNKRVRAVIQGAGFLMGTAVFVMAAWQIFARAIKMQRSGILSDTLQIAYYPLLWVVGFCVVFFALRILIDALLKFREAGQK